MLFRSESWASDLRQQTQEEANALISRGEQAVAELRARTEQELDESRERTEQYVAQLREQAQAEAEALRLRDAWTAHPDHTVLKAMVAERSIFFVLLPLFRFNGDAAMRTVSADISRDEQVHVACNSLVCEELGLRPSLSLDKLRKATIQWVLEPLGTNTQDRYLDKKFWANASDRLMYEGKAPELSDTRRARMPAFFEHANPNLPQYA